MEITQFRQERPNEFDYKVETKKPIHRICFPTVRRVAEGWKIVRMDEDGPYLAHAVYTSAEEAVKAEARALGCE